MAGAYFFRIWNINALSGPTDGSTLLNSLLIHRLPSNCGNCDAIKVFAIGVDDPHLTLLTRPSEIAAFMNAGAVSGVKSRMIPPPSPANCDIASTCEVA